MSAILLRGRQGLGDNIYQRAIVRELAGQTDVYLETAWPQLVGDLPIKCVRRPSTLRTQAKNAARRELVWHTPPRGLLPKVIGYAGSKGSMLQGFCDSAGLTLARVTFDLPAFGPPRPLARPYVVLRPATVRKEWPAAARNPRPEYIALAADKLRSAGVRVVSVADLAPGAEWALEPLPAADETYHHGELDVEELMALVAGAAGCVGGVGWLVPAAVAYRTPLFLIYGGAGADNGPQRIFDPRIPSELVRHAIPDRFCNCTNRLHSICDKRIADIEQRLDTWVMGLRARAGPAVAT